MRPGVTMGSLRYRRMARGGFFKKLIKGVSKVVRTVTNLPVIGAVAKTAVNSLPIVGQVTTAVAAFKSKTPSGAGHAAHAGTKTPTPSQFNVQTNAPHRRKRAKKAKRPKRARKSASRRKGGGTAKQRAARARFAAAARKGKIRKGTRL